MLKQVDARAAHLEKVDADVREWEKKTSKAAEADLKSRAAQIANDLAQSHADEKFLHRRSTGCGWKTASRSRGSAKDKDQRPNSSHRDARRISRFGRMMPLQRDSEVSGEQIDSTDCAHCRRKRRRTSGERAGRRERRQQDQRGASESARDSKLRREPIRTVVILSGVKESPINFWTDPRKE